LRNDCAHCEIEHGRQLLQRWVTACNLAGVAAVSADLRDNPLLALIADSKAYLSKVRIDA